MAHARPDQASRYVWAAITHESYRLVVPMWTAGQVRATSAVWLRAQSETDQAAPTSCRQLPTGGGETNAIRSGLPVTVRPVTAPAASTATRAASNTRTPNVRRCM